jgi:hypothetical protein
VATRDMGGEPVVTESPSLVGCVEDLDFSPAQVLQDGYISMDVVPCKGAWPRG